MSEIIKTNRELCTGCNRCVRECPMEMVNITRQDENGSIKVEIDHEKCIACGRCLAVCKHNARYYEDDTARFFGDLEAGVPISLIAAPAARTNIPEYKRLFTYLKGLGVRKIYDVSLGADICIWAHVRYLEQGGRPPMITAPCPAIVEYCEIYHHDLLDKLSPIHSPMGCVAVYIREYEGVTDAIAALSPCAAKSNEFEDTSLAQYNVTFARLLEYLEENGIELPAEETGFDACEGGIGSLFPMPGGLKENLEFFLGKKCRIDRAEGFVVYEKLDIYAQSPAEILPQVFDVLSCREGCNMGTACRGAANPFSMNRIMDEKRTAALESMGEERLKSVYAEYDKTLNPAHFTREYRPVPMEIPQLSDEDIEKAFLLLGKTTDEKRNVDCGACGNTTCYQMARKVALGVNIPENCIVKALEDARAEHAENLAAHAQLAALEREREADERTRIMLDATPIGAHIWDRSLRIIDCNQESVRLFNLSGKREYMNRYFEFSPEFQPDGTESEQKIYYLVKKAFDDGYVRDEWMYQTPDGEKIPVEKTMVRVNYKGDALVAVYNRDLREYKRMAETLETTAARLKSVVSNYSGVIWSVDMNNIITLFNGKYLDAMGIKPDFIEGKSLERAREKNRHLDIIEKVKKTITKGPQEWLSEVDGKMFRSFTTPIHDKNGSVTGVVGHLDDMTEIMTLQRDLAEALEDAETALARLEAAQFTMSRMFDSNPHINVLFDSDYNVIDCNPAALAFSGFKSKQELIDGFLDLMLNSIPPFQSNGKASLSVVDRFLVVEKKGFTNFKTEMIIDGQRRYLDVELKKIPYENSFAIVAYLLDMTDVYKREMELNSARETNELQLTKLNLVVKGTKIGLWDMESGAGDPLNPKNVFTWSDELRHMLGFSSVEDFPNVLGSWSDRIHPNDKDRVLAAFKKHLLDKTGKTPYDLEYQMMKKNGEYAYYRASGETIRDEKGNAVRVSGALMDITEVKNTLIETERLRAEADAANKAKSSFLSTVSHEIRTPLNAVLGITEIQLRNETLNAEAKSALEKIYASGDLLLGIINDILDLSKIEAGKLEIIPTSYEIASLLSDTTQLNTMRIGSKPIEFELSIDEHLPSTLMGDELRVKQILNNLLSNAFKYTAEGTVKLTVNLETNGGDGDNVIIVFRVSDTGQGMAKEQVDKLFDEYSRFNLEANRTAEGTGLGMSITKNLVRLMNGEIAVESEPGKGSLFTVRLPQIKVGVEELGGEMVENLHKFRTSSNTQLKRAQLTHEPMPYGSVLIVDDVEMNIYVAKGLVASYGVKTDSADSGFEAINKIKRGKVYDIIFMDHMMPKMDGVEAVKILRDMGYTQAIVALTANAVTGQADMFLENGFDDFISKPIDVRQLDAVMKKYIRDRYIPRDADE